MDELAVAEHRSAELRLRNEPEQEEFKKLTFHAATSKLCDAKSARVEPAKPGASMRTGRLIGWDGGRNNP